MNILIIKLGALGDIILATPIIKEIQRFHNEDEITLLTSSQFKPLFSDWTGINVVAYPRKGLTNSVKTICWMRRHKFEKIYDLQSSDRTRIYCCLSGTSQVAGLHDKYPYNIHPVGNYTGQCHIFERHNMLLSSAGINTAIDLPVLPVSGDTELKINTWLNTHGLSSKRFVIMHAGASKQHVTKRWPWFKELAIKIKNTGLDIVWIGSNDDSELNKKLAIIHGHDATNSFSIGELVALGRNALFAVTNDSGPMHVLSCSEIPVFAFFGPTNWQRNHALGQADHVISADKLYRDKNPSGPEEFIPRDLIDISADDAWQFLLKHNLVTD